MPCSGTAPNLICTVAKTSLSNGAYSFKAYVNDTLGRRNSTSYLTYTVNVVVLPPAQPPSGGGGGSGGGGFAAPSVPISVKIINISEEWQNVILPDNSNSTISVNNENYTIRIIKSNQTFAIISINATDGHIFINSILLKKDNLALVDIGEEYPLALTLIMKNNSKITIQMRLEQTIKKKPAQNIVVSNKTSEQNNTIEVMKKNSTDKKEEDSTKTIISSSPKNLWPIGAGAAVFLIIAVVLVKTFVLRKPSYTMERILEKQEQETQPQKKEMMQKNNAISSTNTNAFSEQDSEAIQKIERYIAYYLSKNHSEKEIIAACVKSGWKKEIITEMIKKMKK
jgi:hypothetical protein